MNQTELIEVVRASRDQVWEVLFTQYGDIHIHNPTMQASNYIQGATSGGLNCVRHCEFSDKLFLDEEIAEVDEAGYSFRVVVLEHNLPFVKAMAATYELSSIEDDVTKVRMVSFNSFSPGFMKYLMRGQMKKSVAKHLFGMRYYIETGNSLDTDNYSQVFRDHK